jgi:hypothetical protein
MLLAFTLVNERNNVSAVVPRLEREGGLKMPTVGPITSTIVPMAYDSDSIGFGGPVDMTGPAIGSVSYHQDAADDLSLTITVDFGQPSTIYQVFLVCGPSHALGCGFRDIGTVATNVVGQGSTTIVVPFPVLRAPPFGPGYRTDHLDLLVGAGDLSKGVLTAGALNYFVCRERVGTQAAQPTEAERQSATGDPLGAMASGTDPLARP